MNRSELIDALAKQTEGVSKKQLNQLIDDFTEVLSATLAHGEPVIFPGFGKLEPRQRVARSGRNPQTGQTMTIPARKTVGFKAYPALKARLNESAGSRNR